MPRATFILVNGTRTELEVPAGQSLMQAATRHGIDDIVADCGGALNCASCHVFVEAEFQGVCPPPTTSEEQMLEFVLAGRAPNSRLSCQLVMTESMDGIVVRIAHPQI